MELLQPKGVRDFPPEEKISRDRILAVLKEQFERFGFNPLETPVLERYEVLSAKYAGGAEILKETFTLTDQGERKLGLRYDLTVPLARYVAMNPTVKLPFKRYAIGTVYRDGPIKLGRYREFYQCDCDIVGANTAVADAQCLQLGFAVFDALEFPITMYLNSVPLLRVMLAADGVQADRLDQAMLILDKLKKIGEEGVVRELEEAGIPGAAARNVIRIAQLPTNDARIDAIQERYGPLAELERVRQVLLLTGDARLTFDPSLARGLSYYTGVVFETFLDDSPITSSISAGGRYDRMIGGFLDRPDDFPAVGISFGLEPITEAMKLAGRQSKRSVVDIFIIPIKTADACSALAQELRAAGFNVDMDIMERGISKNLDYANQLGIPCAIIIGQKELAEGKCTLKDMASGEERQLDKAALLDALRERLR